MVPSDRHGDGNLTEERLDTQKLLDLAVQLLSQYDIALTTQWGKRKAWQPYLAAVEALALGLESSAA